MITTPMKHTATATRGRARIDAEPSNNSPAATILTPASHPPTFFVVMATICGLVFERRRNPA